MVGRISFPWITNLISLRHSYSNILGAHRTSFFTRSFDCQCCWKCLRLQTHFQNLITFVHGRYTKYLILVLIGFIFFVCLYFTMDVRRFNSNSKRRYTSISMEHTDNSEMHYGVVIDCGSSGSRVFIYYWPPHNGNPEELLKINQMIDHNGSPVRMKIKPGISSMANNASAASEYIKPLLEFAATHVPKSKHQETPLYILATAGMRMLPKLQQEAILDDLKVDIPVEYNFHFQSTHVEIISGKQEGVYSWIGINYVLGRFDHTEEADGYVTPDSTLSDVPRKQTVGSLDMGGGSAQIAFEVSQHETVPSEFLAEINLGCDSHMTVHKYRVYVTTFLGFGTNSAYKFYLSKLLSQEHPQKDRKTGAILDPCFPIEFTELVRYEGKEYTLKGTGDFLQCRNDIFPLLNKTVPCSKPNCSFNGIHQSHINFHHSEFYGFSEYWYSMHDVLRIGGKYSTHGFEKSAMDFCRTRWPVLQRRYFSGLYPFADEHRLKYQCFKSAWMTTVFHDGFGFPRSYDNLISAMLVHGKEIQWTLGAILHRTRYLPLREIQHHHLQPQISKSTSYWFSFPYHGEKEFWAILIICSIVVLAAILLYTRRLGKMSITHASVWAVTPDSAKYSTVSSEVIHHQQLV